MLVKRCLICGNDTVVQYPSRYERTKTCSRTCAQKYAALKQGEYQHELARWRRAPITLQPSEYSLVALTRDAQTKVSNEDFHFANKMNWCLGDTGYAKRSQKGSNLRLHRLIAERIVGRPLLADEQVDHINRDRLDNQRQNLRIASNELNSFNRGKQCNNKSGFKGVHQDKRDGRWSFDVSGSGIRIRQSGYLIKSEAAWMRDQFAIGLHGDFAVLNFKYI